MYISFCFSDNLTDNELKQLVKLSLCQLNTADEKDMLPYVLERNGKYYFNVDLNPDEDTKKWDDLRFRMLDERKRSLLCVIQ
jgi:hypothetical protein